MLTVCRTKQATRGCRLTHLIMNKLTDILMIIKIDSADILYIRGAAVTGMCAAVETGHALPGTAVRHAHSQQVSTTHDKTHASQPLATRTW